MHARHFGNLYFFRMALRPDAIQGRIEYRRFVTLRLSSIQFGSFAATFLITFFLTYHYFFLGGGVRCLYIAGKHWMDGREQPQQNHERART